MNNIDAILSYWATWQAPQCSFSVSSDRFEEASHIDQYWADYTKDKAPDTSS